MPAAGVPMKVVQETLGHSSIGLTADTYTSVYPQVAVEAAAKDRAARRAVADPGMSTPLAHTPASESAGADHHWSSGGAGGIRTHDLTDYESAALTG